MSDRFDEFGGIITDSWLNSSIEFPCDQIRIVDTAEDQAFAVTHYLAELGDDFSGDEITVGVPDPDIQPQIERSLSAAGVKFRDLKGQPLRDTAPVKLMSALIDYVEQQTYLALAALIRHPDMFQWISEKLGRQDWLTYVDDFQSDYLPDRIELGTKNPFGDRQQILTKFEALPDVANRFVVKADTLNSMHQHLANLLEQVAGPSQKIGNWAKPWCGVLTEIYGHRQLDKSNFAQRQVLEACTEIYQALIHIEKVPPDWKVKTSSGKALQMAIDAAADRHALLPPIEGSIELSGWLDLPLDDAPVVIVTGMNDEHVPASELGHLFLPDKLCKSLGIIDNDRRYARDAYAMTLLHKVRKHVLLIAGRKDLQGEPKKPSRLLFADDDETITRRANAFFAYDGKSNSRFWLADPAHSPTVQTIPIPEPSDVPIIEELSVTSFR
ncbi:MAG: hypothetical protein AAGA30_21545, partial [Planctomycetota bacterium]